MKIYILTHLNLPEYSHEVHVISASGKRELKEIATKHNIDLRNFDVDEKSKTGLIYTDIY